MSDSLHRVQRRGGPENTGLCLPPAWRAGCTNALRAGQPRRFPRRQKRLLLPETLAERNRVRPKKGGEEEKPLGETGAALWEAGSPGLEKKQRETAPAGRIYTALRGCFGFFIWGQTRRLYQWAGGRDVYASSGKAGAAPAPTRKMPADMPLVTAFRAAAAFINTYKSPRRRTCPVCPRRYIFSASFPCP